MNKIQEIINAQELYKTAVTVEKTTREKNLQELMSKFTTTYGQQANEILDILRQTKIWKEICFGNDLDWNMSHKYDIGITFNNQVNNSKLYFIGNQERNEDYGAKILYRDGAFIFATGNGYARQYTIRKSDTTEQGEYYNRFTTLIVDMHNAFDDFYDRFMTVVDNYIKEKSDYALDILEG